MAGMTDAASAVEAESPTRRRGYGLGFWCALALAIFALYVGAYYALLTRELGARYFHRAGRFSVAGQWQPRFSSNKKANDVMLKFFAPLYRADLKIRHAYWHAPFQ